MDKNITPRVELAARPMNAPSGCDISNGMADSEREEQPGVTTPFESAIERNDTLQEFIFTDETRVYDPDETSEFFILRTHLDRQSHTH